MPRSVRCHETGGPEVRIAVKALGRNRAESMDRSGACVIEPVFPAEVG